MPIARRFSFQYNCSQLGWLNETGDHMAYNGNWLALILVVCFVVALGLHRALPWLRSSSRNSRPLRALNEAVLCVLVVCTAVWLWWQGLAFAAFGEFGPLWPGGVAFAAIVVTCLLAFGLSNSRQRTQLSGVVARLLLALVVSSCVFAALFYVFPSRHLFRGVAGLAIVLAVCGVLTSRMVLALVGRRKA